MLYLRRLKPITGSSAKLIQNRPDLAHPLAVQFSKSGPTLNYWILLTPQSPNLWHTPPRAKILVSNLPKDQMVAEDLISHNQLRISRFNRGLLQSISEVLTHRKPAGLKALTSFLDTAGIRLLYKDRLSQFIPDQAMNFPGRTIGSLAVLCIADWERAYGQDSLRKSPRTSARSHRTRFRHTWVHEQDAQNVPSDPGSSRDTNPCSTGHPGGSAGDRQRFKLAST